MEKHVIDGIIYKFISPSNPRETNKQVISEFKYKSITKRIPKYPNYQEWFVEYEIDLIYMFNILIKGINVRFSNKINLSFEEFCKFIYENSSKSIEV